MYTFPSEYNSKGWEVTASVGGSGQPYLCALTEIIVSKCLGGGSKRLPPMNVVLIGRAK